MVENKSGLAIFDLTLDEAQYLSKGKRRSIARYLVFYGYYEDARSLLEFITAENQEVMQYRLWLISAYIGCCDIEKADLLSIQLLSEYPDHQRVLSIRMQALFAQNDLIGARNIYKNPDESYSYWGHLAEASQKRERWNESEYALHRAMSLYRAKHEENPEELPMPIYLLAAAIAQGEHNGEDISQLREEFEQLQRSDEEKVRAELAKPNPKGHSTPKHSPLRPVNVVSENPSPEMSSVVLEQPPVVPVVSGHPCPETLGALSPNPTLQKELKDYYGYSEFRPGQQNVVELVLEGKSVLAVMPTGAGKSLCYQLPAMLLNGITLVISPLIALMKDQVDGLPLKMQEQATLINSTLEGDKIEQRLSEIRAGKYKMVYAAPERLRQRPFLHALRSRGLSLMVVDEAHCVSMWGQDFRPDYLFIKNALEYLNHPPVLAMTATAGPQMRLEISNHFGRRLQLVSTGTHRPNLFLESIMVRTDEEKMQQLVRICQETDGAGIVYTRSRKKAEELTRIIRREKISAAFYHAGMDGGERAKVQDEFMDGRWRIICATVAFGMGIDKSDVRFVIHYSLPSALEDYYQEAGRAGRDGQMSKCILLCSSSDKALNTRWMRQERMDLAFPRECYQYIRGITKDSAFVSIHADELERDLGQDETRIRVAISMLETVGLLKRHLDVPTTVSLTLTSNGANASDPDFSQFISAARLRINQRTPIETTALCKRVSIGINEIEEKLLLWRDQGYIYYHSSGRVMLIERLAAPTNAKQLIMALLSKYTSAQEKQVEKAFHYAETFHCKHDTIAEHFGEPGIEGCKSCDNCVPQKQPTVGISKQAKPIKTNLTDDQKRQKVLETVRMVSGHVGFTGLVRVLKGSVASHIKRDRCPNFGIFADYPKATIERCVQELLDDGYLERDDSEYRLISLGNDN